MDFLRKRGVRSQPLATSKYPQAYGNDLTPLADLGFCRTSIKPATRGSRRSRMNSIVLFAVLSAIVAPAASSAGRAILKFKDGYSAGDAYGALADLKALEILCAVIALFPDDPAHFCTAVRGLALFWAGTQASNFIDRDGRCQSDLSPIEALLPGKSINWWLDLPKPETGQES